MKKTDLLIGTLIGFMATFIGVYVFFTFFTEYSFTKGVAGMKEQGFLGKVITLGAIANLLTFFILLRMNKELMARGVVLSTILITILTLFI